MPNIDDIMSGRVEVNALKKVEVEDLLGREPVSYTHLTLPTN